jgi:hypothetical protein
MFFGDTKVQKIHETNKFWHTEITEITEIVASLLCVAIIRKTPCAVGTFCDFRDFCVT